MVHVWQTTVHKGWVAYYMARLWPVARHSVTAREWARRAVVHDWTKYRPDEALAFATTILELRDTTYGSDEYRALLRRIKPSIDLHYRRWDHHPEHWASYYDMAMTAKLEMIADWAAAVRRHADGDLAASIRGNATRFGYGPSEQRFLFMCAKAMGAL